MTALLVIGIVIVVAQFGYIVWLDRRNRQLYTEARRLREAAAPSRIAALERELGIGGPP